MKKTSSKEYEKDYVDRVKKVKDRKKVHDIREIEQEKFLLKEINTYLEKNDIIDKEIFDSFSHELRTPIVTIKTYIDMILKGKFGKVPSEQKIKLIRVSENTDLLIDVIMKLLDKIKERE